MLCIRYFHNSKKYIPHYIFGNGYKEFIDCYSRAQDLSTTIQSTMPLALEECIDNSENATHTYLLVFRKLLSSNLSLNSSVDKAKDWPQSCYPKFNSKKARQRWLVVGGGFARPLWLVRTVAHLGLSPKTMKWCHVPPHPTHVPKPQLNWFSVMSLYLALHGNNAHL